ncbi:hypothetical protein BGX34_010347 [Mortierella sp. NVP85]|nr:hypothetical protein BGX34_010347 [Mortierella sp. NVP85]
MIELGMINNKIISKIAAERWNAESEPVKAWYRLKAKRCKEEHARNYPGYKYAPNKKPTVAPSLHTHISGGEKDMHSDYSKHLVVTRDPTGQQQQDLQRKPTQGKTSNKSYCRRRADAENLHSSSALPVAR